jgi:hypothetical protein
MPIIIAEIEQDTDVSQTLTKDEKMKLLDFVYEEENDLILIEDSGDTGNNGSTGTDSTSGTSGSSGITDGTPPTQPQTTQDKRVESKPPKQKTKSKNNKSPQDSPQVVDSSGAQTKAVINSIKNKSNPTSTAIRVTSFIEQGKINDSSYWAYRKVDGPGTYKKKINRRGKLVLVWDKSDGTGVIDNQKNPSIVSILGFVKYRFGASWDKLTRGIDIRSIWDVIISMNIPQVGIFNNIVPYIAEENTEQHMMILQDNMVYKRGEDTSIGLYQGNPSWAHEPFWCGVWTDFLTFRAGLSRVGGATTSVDKYHRRLAAKGLVNAPNTITNNSVGPIKFHESWLPSKEENLNPNGVGAIFVNGYHYSGKTQTLLDPGKKLLEYLLGLNWSMATVSVGTDTHIETCAYLNESGIMITIGGNTSGNNDRNGTQFYVKHQSIATFGADKQYVVFGKITGNTQRTSGGLNSKYIITPTMQSYIESVNNKKKNINNSLASILKKII